MNTKKIIGIVIVVALVIGAVVFGQQTGVKTVKIGVILPLSGTQAYSGEGMKDALELAKENLKNTKYDYELVIEDGALDVKTSISAANKLITTDKVDAIIDAYAPIGNAVSPITEKSGITHIDIAFDPKIAEGEYNFILFTTPDTAAKSFLLEIQRRGIKTLGIFRVNNQGIFAVYSAIKAHANEYGVEIISDELFQPGERDFKSIVAKGTQAKAGLYALLALPPELEILAKQLKDQGITAISSTIYFELAKDKTVFEGLWSIGYGEIDQKFESQFKSKYQRELGFGSPNVYDAFNVIVTAAESHKGGKPNSTDIRDSIQKIGDFEGVLGKLHVDEVGIIDHPTLVKTVKNGIMVPLE
jgi:branched-chain amino acid transport system substrate-binding protein